MAFDRTGKGAVLLRVCFAKHTLVSKLQSTFVDLEFNGAPALRCGSCESGAIAVDGGGGGSSAAEECTEDLPCVQHAIEVLLGAKLEVFADPIAVQRCLLHVHHGPNEIDDTKALTPVSTEADWAESLLTRATFLPHIDDGVDNDAVMAIDTATNVYERGMHVWVCPAAWEGKRKTQQRARRGAASGSQHTTEYAWVAGYVSAVNAGLAADARPDDCKYDITLEAATVWPAELRAMESCVMENVKNKHLIARVGGKSYRALVRHTQKKKGTRPAAAHSQHDSSSAQPVSKKARRVGAETEGGAGAEMLTFNVTPFVTMDRQQRLRIGSGRERWGFFEMARGEVTVSALVDRVRKIYEKNTETERWFDEESYLYAKEAASGPAKTVRELHASSIREFLAQQKYKGVFHVALSKAAEKRDDDSDFDGYSSETAGPPAAELIVRNASMNFYNDVMSALAGLNTEEGEMRSGINAQHAATIASDWATRCKSSTDRDEVLGRSRGGALADDNIAWATVTHLTGGMPEKGKWPSESGALAQSGGRGSGGRSADEALVGALRALQPAAVFTQDERESVEDMQFGLILDQLQSIITWCPVQDTQATLQEKVTLLRQFAHGMAHESASTIAVAAKMPALLRSFAKTALLASKPADDYDDYVYQAPTVSDVTSVGRTQAYEFLNLWKVRSAMLPEGVRLTAEDEEAIYHANEKLNAAEAADAEEDEYDDEE